MRLIFSAVFLVLAITNVGEATPNKLIVNTQVGAAEVSYGETTVYLIGGNPDPVYVEENNSAIWSGDTVHVKFQGTRAWNYDEIRYDDVKIPIKYLSDNPKVVRIVKDGVGAGDFWCRAPGIANITVKIGDHAGRFSIKVVKLPITLAFTPSKLIKVLGSPTSRKVLSDSVTTHIVDGVHKDIADEEWTWAKYPGFVLIVDPSGMVQYTYMADWKSVLDW